MKILAFSDTHGRDLRQLIERADQEGVDIAFACGDWTMMDEVPKYFASQFLNKKKNLFVLPGNHETMSTLYSLIEQYGINHLHGKGIIVGDIGFFGAGSATQIGPISRITEQEMWQLLEKAHEQVKDAKKKVMIVHEHPKGSVMEFGMFAGSESIKKAIELFKPDLVICGHIHEAAGVEEKIAGIPVINVAKEGKIIDV